MFSEDPILLPEIVDQIRLGDGSPSQRREDEELQRRRHSLRLLGRLDQHRPSLAAFSHHTPSIVELSWSSGRGRTEPSDGRPRPDERYCRGTSCGVRDAWWRVAALSR